jgi:hypothetical protein
MLGIEVAKSTVARCMTRRQGPASQSWKTFLPNHAAGIASIDPFVVRGEAPRTFDTAGADCACCVVVLKPRKLGGFVPCGTRAHRVQICAHFREIAKAEACLLNHGEDWTIGAIDEREVVAQHPFLTREATFNDSDHAGQGFFAASDCVFVRANPEHLGLQSGLNARSVAEGEMCPDRKEQPTERVRPPRCRRRPPRALNILHVETLG